MQDDRSAPEPVALKLRAVEVAGLDFALRTMADNIDGCAEDMASEGRWDAVRQDGDEAGRLRAGLVQLRSGAITWPADALRRVVTAALDGAADEGVWPSWAALEGCASILRRLDASGVAA